MPLRWQKLRLIILLRFASYRYNFRLPHNPTNILLSRYYFSLIHQFHFILARFFPHFIPSMHLYMLYTPLSSVPGQDYKFFRECTAKQGDLPPAKRAYEEISFLGHPGNLFTKTHSFKKNSIICVLVLWHIYVCINPWNPWNRSYRHELLCGCWELNPGLWKNSHCSWVISPAPRIFIKTFLICALKTNRTVTFKWILKGIFFFPGRKVYCIRKWIVWR